ncbi:MAG TPA: hypothetical protein VK636_05195 [Gemmatimonadaceae bacterium]|nr:hypothetical protein [Gemmatimonadaceae bacterium]
MATLDSVLFPAADYRRTTLSLLSWWESRRATFNIVVGATGVFTLVVTRLISLLPPGVAMPFDWRPIVAYAVLANVCFTFGWGVEAVAQRIWGRKCPAIGPALFRQGLAFSVGLTLLPILLVSIGWLAHLVSLILR